jgi:membrane protein
VKAVMDNADKNPKMSGISGIIGFVVIAVSASAIFAQLRNALNKVNEHKPGPKQSGLMAFLKERFLSVGLVLGFAFLSIVSLLFTTFIAVAVPSGEGMLWHAISTGINLLLFTGLFTAIYRFVPSDRMRWKRCLISGAVSAVFYLIGKTLIGIYLGKAGFESSYGAAGSLVVFLAWVFYTALTLLISYEFTKNLVLPLRQQEKREAQADTQERVSGAA